MQRREFTTWLGSSFAWLATAQSFAQQTALPPAGSYISLSTPVPSAAPKGKIEVIEFFSYGCPHCAHFEPELEAWVSKLPSDVYFHQVPVAFRPNWIPYQKLFYALDAMKQSQPLARKIFEAIHTQQLALDQLDSAVSFVNKNGVDGKKFADLYNSFGIQTKVNQADKLLEQYKIEGVPTLAIAGRYLTSPSIAQSVTKSLTAANALIATARSSATKP